MSPVETVAAGKELVNDNREHLWLQQNTRVLKPKIREKKNSMVMILMLRNYL